MVIRECARRNSDHPRRPRRAPPELSVEMAGLPVDDAAEEIGEAAGDDLRPRVRKRGGGATARAASAAVTTMTPRGWPRARR